MLDYKILKSEKEIREASETLLGFPEVSFDLETTGLKTHSGDLEVVGLGFSWKEKQGIYIPVNYDHGLSHSEIIELFRDVLESESVGIIGQNIKYDARVCHRFGINVNNIVFDTFIAHYCLFGDRYPHNLDDISMQHLNVKKIRTKDLIPKKSKTNPNPSMKDMPVDDVGYYCVEDTDTTFRLKKYFIDLFNKKENKFAKDLFYNIELPLLPVLIDMECNGVALDTDWLDDLHNKYISRIQYYTNYIYKKVGKEFSLTAPTEVAEAFYDTLHVADELGIEVPVTEKSGQRKTDAETLGTLKDHKAVRALLKVKGYQKLLKTYILGLKESISPVTGLVHASFNQCLTSTGRLSSSAPNLQNIPVRTHEGRNIRRAFISRWADKGGIIYSPDLGQAELRILAHLSEDETLIEAFKNNVDVHKKVARKAFKIAEEDEVPSVLRSRAKVLSFGLIYGMKASKLSRDFNVSKQEAQTIIDDYLDNMPGVKNFLAESEQFMIEHGYTETLCGRRRYVPKAFSDNILEQWSAGREAVNFLVQGLNADIMKIAMVKIHSSMKDHNLKSKMILQVHDEVVFDVYPGEFPLLESIVRDSMENAVTLNVPMVAEGEPANNWSDAH